MIEAFFNGFSMMLAPNVLLVMLGGVLVGLIVGILPGLGGTTTLALLLPFIWGAKPEVALGLLVALNAVVFTSGGITSILLNVPGENANVPTLLDGYPMNKKGQGARAIGATVMSSMLGGIVAVFLAIGMVFLIKPIVLAFKSPEVFFMVIIGISFIAVLTGDSVIKGLISGGLGILLSFVGYHAMTGVPRFTFGSVFLYDRIHLAVFIMGFFGLSEMMNLIIGGQASISEKGDSKVRLRDTLEGAMDVFRHWGLWLRCSIIGYIVGVIPGIGAGTATWVAYAQAKQLSKTPEKFGTGCIEGVIAPEAADNASTAGSLLTTMVFGIPGSSSGAILLGGFMLVGVVPGPSMLTENADLLFALLAGIAIANLIAGFICMGTASYMSRIAFVPIDFIFATIVAIILIAAVATDDALLDLVVVVAAGLLGLGMKRFGYSLAALALGFVLGGLFEYYFFMALKLTGPWFFLKPVCLIEIALLVGLFAYRPLMAFWGRRYGRAQ